MTAILDSGDHISSQWPEAHSPVMIPESVLMRQHCGLFHCPLESASALMPVFDPVFKACPIKGIIDVRVSMLMPGQYPCIPNWHYDFVPRDSDGTLLMDERDPSQVMYFLISGPPVTEFRDGRKVRPWKWLPFTQFDEHRGTTSDRHCWRVFMRVVPETLLRPANPEQWKRRHCQVYLDAGNFTW